MIRLTNTITNAEDIKYEYYTETIHCLKGVRTWDLIDNTLSIPDNSRVVDVINMLKIPDELPKIILINGAQKKPESELSEGDELSIFPPISGG